MFIASVGRRGKKYLCEVSTLILHKQKKYQANFQIQHPFKCLVKKNNVLNFFSLCLPGITMFRHFDIIMTSDLNFFMNLNSEPKILLSTKFEFDQVIILKIIQVFLYFHLKNDVTP